MRRRLDHFLAARLVLVASMCALAGGFAGCSDDKRSPLPDWSAGYERGGPMAAPQDDAGVDGGLGDGGGVVLPDDNPPPPDTFAIRHADIVRWPMRIRDRDALEDGRTEPCYVEPGPKETELEYSGKKKIRCIIDVDELDLYVNGLQFDLIVPKGMCDFVERIPYWFENWETGIGPKVVSYTKEGDGRFSDEVNSVNGEPICKYDHGSVGGPNACLGDYDLVVKDAMTGVTTTKTHEWGGNACDALCGANWLDTGKTVVNTCPAREIIYVGRERLVLHESFEDELEHTNTNLMLANFYDPKDHGGSRPAGLVHESNLLAHPLYEYYCVDDAEENIAHINVVVREWNEEVEFDSEGDPDTVGTEPRWDLFITDEINDLRDWKDQTPDAVTYPQVFCEH